MEGFHRLPIELLQLLRALSAESRAFLWLHDSGDALEALLQLLPIHGKLLVQGCLDPGRIRLLPAIAGRTDQLRPALGPETLTPAFVDLQLQSAEAPQISRLDALALDQQQIVLLQQHRRQGGPQPGDFLPQRLILRMRTDGLPGYISQDHSLPLFRLASLIDIPQNAAFVKFLQKKCIKKRTASGPLYVRICKCQSMIWPQNRSSGVSSSQ